MSAITTTRAATAAGVGDGAAVITSDLPAAAVLMEAGLDPVAPAVDTEAAVRLRRFRVVMPAVVTRAAVTANHPQRRGPARRFM